MTGLPNCFTPAFQILEAQLTECQRMPEVAETDDEVEQSEQSSQSRSDSATLPASRATAYQRTMSLALA
ncbi:hypothetical protein AK812_SmicGene6539 [Symbiodinium microadriaticum]|uniref:Uncharacterized protein n=1 Tax=Symbiodinium microadriaticum TaxID=2951 RepID=A0A1Q9EQX3_SYMMI|nr:hypothetical protein AK812_SmicGene6539 [Symbiodinium microadriaticum]